MYRKSLFVILFCLMVMLCGCGQSTPVEVVSYYQDDNLMQHYGNAYTDYTSVEYEQVSLQWQDASGRESSVGPGEPKYRGVIHLSEEQAEQLMESYGWTEDTPQTVFDAIEFETSDSDSWYTSKEFEKELFTKVAVNYVYFNGVDAIVFEIQVM